MANREQFVSALRRYVGALEYRPGKSCIVVETESGPRGFCDCAGLPLLALRDIGVLSSALDINFPGSSNREREIMRLLHRHGKRIRQGTPFFPGDILVSGTVGKYHVMTVSQLDYKADTMRVIEAPRSNALVCERSLDVYERYYLRSAFRLF